jgi:hypothetical protein
MKRERGGGETLHDAADHVHPTRKIGTGKTSGSRREGRWRVVGLVPGGVAA